MFLDLENQQLILGRYGQVQLLPKSFYVPRDMARRLNTINITAIVGQTQSKYRGYNACSLQTFLYIYYLLSLDI